MESIIEGEITEMDENIDMNDSIERIEENMEERSYMLRSKSEDLDRDVEENVSPTKIHYLKDLRDLREKCLCYKKAHSECRSFHFMYDKIIKISTLGLSTLTTYFISSHNNDDMTPEDLDIDRKLTFITTLVSGINVIFNFSEKMEIHKTLNIEYFDLYNDIEETVRLFTETTREQDIKGIFQGYNKTFKELTKRTSEIGIIRYIKNKHKTI